VALLAGMAGAAGAQVMTLTVSPNPINYGEPITLTTTITGDNNCGGQTVTFDAGGSYSATASQVTSSKCTATVSVPSTPSLTPGSYLLGTFDTNLPVGYAYAQLAVSKAAPTVGVASSLNPSTVGQTVTFTAAVSPQYSGAAVPAGSVTFFVDGTAKPSAGLSNGTAQFTTSALAIGKHSVYVGYSGDGNYTASQSSSLSQTVNGESTVITLQAGPNPSTVGQSVALIANVSPIVIPGGPTGTVTFYDGATQIASAPLIAAAGLATAGTSSLTAGTHTLTASYSGDSAWAASTSNTVSQVVNRVTTTTSLQAVPGSSTAGQNVTLTATVSPSSATGTVTFLDGSSTIGTANLSAGTAAFSISTLAGGNHSLTASYGGDTNDAPSTSAAVTESVGQAPTNTTLRATPNPATIGQNVTLTATVSPSSATGTVTFLDGATSIGSANLSAGTATIGISTLATGNHSLTASYGGDTNDAASTSAAVTESVGLAPTNTTLRATPNPATVGQNVTLTATVTPSSASGTVTFLDGSTTIGAAAVTAGAATLSTSTLTTGNHSLTASYSGDMNNAASTSAAVTESVTGSTSTAVPDPVSVSPASGSESSQVMTFTFNDPNGWQDLDVVNVLINNVLDGRSACYLAYSRSVGVLYLVEDDGGTLSTGLPLGGSGSVSNSQCSVAGAASVAMGSGNTLTVTLNLSFTAGFGGNKVVYLAARDVGGGNSGWQALGVWQAPFTPSGTISVVSLGAARGAAAAGTPQTYTATLMDSKGVSDFGVVNLLVNNFIDGRIACYLAFAAASNTLLLVDDGGDAGGPFAGSLVLNGGAGTIQNSQCSVNGAGSAAVKSGNTLTLILNLTFQSSFKGNQIVWLAGRDGAGANNTGWQATGTATVQ